MKRIGLTAVAVLAVAAAVGSKARPAEYRQLTEEAAGAGVRVWDGVERNPVPSAVAAATFVLTLGLRKGRKAVAEAPPAPQPAQVPAAEVEPAVVRRAKARATRTQLLADHIGLEARKKKLAGEVTQAEKDLCYTGQGVADAERVLADRRKAHAAATDRLAALTDERRQVRDELTAIGAELQKLAGQV